jgi:hypothetical protein
LNKINQLSDNGHEAWAGAVARQGRHHDPIGELEGADLHALEQRLDG